MKKLLLALFLSLNGLIVSSQTPFDPGNLLVLRAGDGQVSSGTVSVPASVVEYNKEGQVVQKIDIPSTGASKLVLSNTSSSTKEGFLNLSVDDNYVTFAGYDASTGIANLQNSSGVVTSGGYLRAIGRFNASGTYSVVKTNFPGGNAGVRSVIQADSNRTWTTSYANFMRYVNKATSVSSSTWSTSTYNITNNNDIGIFNNKIYFSSAGTASGLYAVNTSTNLTFPMSSTAAIPTLLPIPSLGSIPNGFVFFDTDENGTPDLLYIADENAAIGLQKYYFDGTNWIAKGTVQVPAEAANKSLSDLTGLYENGSFTLYGNTASTIVSFTDTASPDASISATAKILATTEENYIFRGISFTPGTKKADPRPESYALRMKANSSFIGDITSNVTYRKYSGLEETHLTYTTPGGQPMALFFLTADLANPNIKLEAGMPNGKTTFTTQSVRNQIPYKNTAHTPDFKVIAATNADFWHVSTPGLPSGVPLGPVYLNGTMVKDMPIPDSVYYYLAVMKNGTALMGGLADYTPALKSQINYALGGRYYVTRQYDAYSTTAGPVGDPRTAVGLLHSTKVIFLVVDGRRTGHSGGVTVTEIGLIYRALGAMDAVNLDGGGSSTMVVKEADDTYKVINKPSDNSERAVANNWMILGKTVPVSLPVSIKSFTANKEGNHVKLNWTTASEKNNSHFEIYRSENEKFQMPMGTIPGAGDSQTLRTYSFTDTNPFIGTNYYQLKQVDYDGKAEKSKIISLNTGTGQETFSLHKVENGLQAVVFSESNSSGIIRITDITGRVLSTTNVRLQKGQNTIPLNMPDASGTYIVTLNADGKNKSVKFLK